MILDSYSAWHDPAWKTEVVVKVAPTSRLTAHVPVTALAPAVERGRITNLE